MIRLGYLASPSYSGSTLVAMLLNTHPRLVSVGELKWGAIDLSTYQCSCGSLLRACPFWRDIVDTLARRNVPFDLERPATDFRLRDKPLWDRLLRARVRSGAFERVRAGMLATSPHVRQRLRAVRRVNREAIRTILARADADVFIDASKDPVRLQHLMNTGDYDVRIIHLVRDGRGVANSDRKHNQRGAADAARDWRETHRQVDRLTRRLGSARRFVLHYEALCRRPDATMRQLHEFLGVRPRATPAVYTEREHHILGNRMRLRPAKPIRLDERWRSELAPTEQRAFAAVAGPENEHYGYD